MKRGSREGATVGQSNEISKSDVCLVAESTERLASTRGEEPRMALVKGRCRVSRVCAGEGLYGHLRHTPSTTRAVVVLTFSRRYKRSD